MTFVFDGPTMLGIAAIETPIVGLLTALILQNHGSRKVLDTVEVNTNSNLTEARAAKEEREQAIVAAASAARALERVTALLEKAMDDLAAERAPKIGG